MVNLFLLIDINFLENEKFDFDLPFSPTFPDERYVNVYYANLPINCHTELSSFTTRASPLTSEINQDTMLKKVGTFG